ncbi:MULTISPECIES: IclR family transcriptional regulator [Kocuria]|uniref:IclR family transcriptional regulator n=1 Tax=Kocuria TaxID=57493 RepID=UPI001593438F|nr:IclR family transcriptional regulator [Kocuria salina]MCM3486832.1 IclR family transcriptional regulator [Kocuria rosea]NVC22638.1 IclR family transcriptional regulator [Kocuria salina]
MRSLSRALDVFEQLQRSDRPQRLSELARDCGISLPTTLRLLRVLQDYGLVSQTEKNYRIGPAVLPAARSFLENDPLVLAARPILLQLATQSQLTASLYSRLGYDRILIARVDGTNPLRYDLPLGKRLPLTRGAAGKILIANLGDTELERIAEAATNRRQEEEPFDLTELKSRLPAPDEGYAFSVDERASGVMSAAVAVPHPSGGVTESIALTTPVEAYAQEDLRAQVPELRRAARRLSELLEGVVY